MPGGQPTWKASRLREWFKTKEGLPANALLFPVSAKVRGGVDRRTSKMMKADLKAARKKWIEEAETEKEKRAREESDFLTYKNDSGLFADFHSNRHTFITNLEHVGVSPRKAQSLARHSDIRLTMGVYTHINLNDQSSAIELLPAPPESRPSTKAPGANVAGPVGADGQTDDKGQLDTLWAKLPEHVKAELLAQINQGGPDGLIASLQNESFIPTAQVHLPSKIGSASPAAILAMTSRRDTHTSFSVAGKSSSRQVHFCKFGEVKRPMIGRRPTLSSGSRLCRRLPGR